MSDEQTVMGHGESWKRVVRAKLGKGPRVMIGKLG